MTKKRRAPIRLAVADEEEGTNDEDADEDRPRPAPNTNFLGRLVRGVATGNQRQIDTTTSNAANLSIGATGAASLRLQLQRTRSARFQTLRRVVLSSAEQQRLTLCTALLAEVAQGFGFRLTVRQPDGQEVGARQALAAVAHLRSDAAAAADPEPEAGAAAAATADGEAEEANAAGEATPQPGTGSREGSAGDAAPPVPSAEQAGGVGGADGALPDLMDKLMPLDVELHLGREAGGRLLQAKDSLTSLVGGGLAARLARSPSGLRPARPGGLAALLSGRLTSAALGSAGLVGGPKKTAAAQAVQAAKRRVLMRAASNGAADEASPRGPVKAAAGEADAAADATAPEPGPGDAGANAAAATAAGSAAGAGASGATAGGSSRRIVWDPDKLFKPLTSTTTPPMRPSTATATAAKTCDDSSAAAAPPSKRPRTSAAAVAAATAAAAAAGVDGDDVAIVEAAKAPSGSAADGYLEHEVGEMRAAPCEAGVRIVASGVASEGPDPDHSTERRADADPGCRTGQASEESEDGVVHASGGGEDGNCAADANPGEQHAVRCSFGGDADCGAAAARQEAAAEACRAKASKRPAPAGKDSDVARSSRLLGAALARPAVPTGISRPRPPIHTGTTDAGSSGGGADRPTGAATAPAPIPGEIDTEDEETAGRATGVATGSDQANPVGQAVAGSGAAAQARPGGGGGGRGAGSRAAGKTAGAGSLRSPAGKLFSAAVRQLQRRSQV